MSSTVSASSGSTPGRTQHRPAQVWRPDPFRRFLSSAAGGVDECRRVVTRKPRGPHGDACSCWTERRQGAIEPFTKFLRRL